MLSRIYLCALLAVAVPGLGAGLGAVSQQPTQATTVPLMLPGGLAYDAAGNLYFAETAAHRVREVSPAGVITTVAGSGVQGFGGDGGPAISALLDSPTSIAIDSAGNLFVADSHNHRIRRVDAVSGTISTYAGTGTSGLSPNGTAAASALLDLPAALAFDSAQNLYFADARTHVVRRIDHATGLVTTVAGNGTQGFSGDNGPATTASIDSPSGIALDASGNLYLADTHNQRIRRVDAKTGTITTVSGTGQPGFSGDAASASTAKLSLPRGLALDASGNLFLVDARNQRIRRIDATTGQITSIAGQGTEAYLGDGTPALTASIDSPRAVTVSPANLPTLADSGNNRIRQVDSAALIHTIAGLGNTTPGTLTLTGPSVALYGTGSVTATLVASPATGSVTFFDGGLSLGSAALTANAASFSIAGLAAGSHGLTATYAGDAIHAAGQSDLLPLTISPAPAVATPNSVAMLYGQAVPALSGGLTGILPQDAASVALSLGTTATSASAPGSYPILAALTGAAASDYRLTQAAAAVSVVKAASTLSLSNALLAHVASTTSGVPTGSASLYDGGVLYATVPVSASGDAQFSPANLTNGSHTLTATYSGDVDFLASASSTLVATIGPAASADFTLAASGQGNIAVPAGSPAAFSFTVTPVNGALSSPILLTVAGLPSGATASFNPAYLPPTNTPAAFILTIQTPKTARVERPTSLIFAALLPGAILLLRRRRRLLALAALTLTLGCGDRVNTTNPGTVSVAYNITVTGTATLTSGATLSHSAGVTLTVQH